MTDFSSLKLAVPLQKNLTRAGYTSPTPIQAQAIPPLLEGRDLLGIAQTGTGKTAAFALPILQRLHQKPRPAAPRQPRALILTPTRELAAQIDASFAAYGQGMNLHRALIFGGVGQTPQVNAMKRGVAILTATPGRLLDLMGQGHIRLDQLEIFVLDEADRMLDMGFIHDIRKVIAQLPAQRQTLFFSATMPQEIASLAAGILTQPVRVEITPQATTVERITQEIRFVDRANKRELLHDLLARQELSRVLVFTRTKHAASRVAEGLAKSAIPAAAIHGNKSQSARTRALEGFRNGEVRVLVATDIAARGIDVDGVSHVINFDLPNEPESYVHRIGRTARAGRDGAAISFCDAEERPLLRDIERTIRMTIPVEADHPYHSQSALQAPGNAAPRRPARNGGGGGIANHSARGRTTGGTAADAPPGARRGNGHRAAGNPPARANASQSSGTATHSRSAGSDGRTGGPGRRAPRRAA